MRAQILTAYAGTGSDADEYHAQITDDYLLQSCRDVTGCPGQSIIPDVNLYAVEIVCDAATLAAIAADVNYHVLWSSET